MSKDRAMHATHDPSADAAHIRLRAIEDRGVASTYTCDAAEVGGMIHLDFDAEGRLIGIEVLDASRKLPPELLAGARRLSR